ncbi:integrase family protein [Paracoccus sp. MA]|uniref:tyrosine-type recombinase/integrase n=1 Tax=Paracoccus sp. MA TaxID=2895796 RepID=UPI001E3892F7|nr:integrase family protein [Paracoccus sp. MA]UFM66773.1 integrase family protein [Paracoccus sp. MA]
MAKVDLTDHMIRRLVVEARTDFPDARAPGLSLRVTPAGAKSWAVRGTAADGAKQRITIGTYPDMSLRDARVRAAAVLSEIRGASGNLNAAKREAATARSGDPTLGELIAEYESGPGAGKAIWARTKRGMDSEARKRIRTVFSGLLGTRVSEIPDEDFADAMLTYEPKSGAVTANGQVSKARAYLMPVLDWAAGRGRFRVAGKRRRPSLDVADIKDTLDPAADDEEISGTRDRALSVDEIKKIWPLLVYPAPESLKMKAHPDFDVRPIALRFIMLTGARLSEVCAARWQHIDFDAKTWFKPSVKSVRGGARSQLLPIPDSVIALLDEIPEYLGRGPNDLIFPGQAGTELGNWTRITSAIMRESGTSGWHRHDLRRTAATIMRAGEVELSTIDRILGHRTDHRREESSRAINAYLADIDLSGIVEDPQRKALERLAEIYDQISRS